VLLKWLAIMGVLGSLMSHNGATAGSYSTSGDERYIVLASRQGLDDAIGVAQSYAWRFPGVRVMRSSNGWYAVAAGPTRVQDARAYREKLLKEGGVATDVLFSKGDGYVAEAWRKPRVTYLLEGSYDGRRAASFSLGDVRVTLGRVKAKDAAEFMPVATGWRGATQVFSMVHGDVVAEAPKSEIVALRLDAASPAPQIVFSAFWGGAHCCTVTKIATLGPGGWTVLDGDVLDGSGYGFEDIDGDGVYELISSDNSFLYAFAPYSDSLAPVRLWRLQGGRLVDATRDSSLGTYHRRRLAAIEHEAEIDPGRWRSNGFLAGWVATKALVGQFENAWARMLVLYDAGSDWPLTECLVPMVNAQCPQGKEISIGFPAALRAHLERNGYMPARPSLRAP
jgi:serine protease Do